MPPPTLVYDADCAFCQRSLEFGRRRLPWLPAVTGYQHADLARLGVTRRQAEHAVQLYWPGRPVRRGAAAVAAILLAQRAFRWRMLGALMSVPPLSWACAAGYAAISRYRHRLPGGSATCRAAAR